MSSENPSNYQTVPKTKATSFGWVPTCPKCSSHNISGVYGVGDSAGKAWALNTCNQCGFKFKYPA